MAPNPGSPLLRGAGPDATATSAHGLESLSLSHGSHYSDFVKISCLLSSLRTDPSHPKYESVSQNVARVAKTYSPVTLPRVFSFDELNEVISHGTSGANSTIGTDTGTDGDVNTDPPTTDQQVVTVFGWCKSIRKQDGGRLLFVIINDGSCKSNLQVVVHQDSNGFEQALKAHSGASVRARGFLVDRFKGAGEASAAKPSESAATAGADDYEFLESVSNKFELHVTGVDSNFVQILGANLFPGRYPISKKSVTLEHLREVAHLRPRSYLISAVMRVRSALAVATHLFFQARGCVYLHSPLITTADCEGAGELFQVTTLLENAHRLSDLATRMGVDVNTSASASNASVDANVGGGSTAASTTVASSAGATVGASTNTGTSTDPVGATGFGPSSKPALVPNAKISFKNDFFKKKSFLTCSGQLSAENYCCSMGSVYTFGPTFRAENSHTSRHLAEFWMIEPELVLCDLSALMAITEQFVKFLVGYALDHCLDDLHFFNSAVDGSLLDRLRAVTAKKFVHISYSDVIDILQKVVQDTKGPPKFEFNDIHWGMDLQSEHERYISEEVFNGPVIIFNYPKTIKAFYMRRNDDKKTVAAMDLIIPKIGELIGGSQREERLDYLLESIKENKLNEDDYWWYLDLRRYGTVVHSGFGLGFERLVMMVTGVNNIRDVIPFPRYPGHSAF